MFADLEDQADALDGNLAVAALTSDKPATARTRKASKRDANRRKALLPAGVPRYVRCYDNGGETIDRYTVVFHGKAAKMNGGGAGWPDQWPYLAMNAAPFHPQGFGQRGASNDRPCDVDRWGFPPALGRKCHLGRRIPFAALPEDCRRLVLSDYHEIWNLKGGAL